MAAPNYLKTAIDHVQQAIAADNEGQDEEAFRLYMKALDWFELSQKYEKNPHTHARIAAKMHEYIARAEALKLKVVPMAAEGAPAPSAKTLVTDKPNVLWSDVAGLDMAKEALKEAAIMPIELPELFSGKLTPWRGILLYGPPGTGKTYLAKALATQARAAFFSATASDLTSKWHGESEKLVRDLFESARANKPAVIFIDEVESLCSSRANEGGGGGSTSGAEDRIKTEFLTQMNGLGKDQEGVLVLGATNLPWALDKAIRRRFERRIYIPLPDHGARQQMFKLNIGETPVDLPANAHTLLADATEGYSGADIAIIVRDALMQAVRIVQAATHFRRVDGKWAACSRGAEGAVEMTWEQVGRGNLCPPRVGLKDFLRSAQTTRPSVSQADLGEYVRWTNEFGMDG